LYCYDGSSLEASNKVEVLEGKPEEGAAQRCCRCSSSDSSRDHYYYYCDNSASRVR
jgi:hypothetical protein